MNDCTEGEEGMSGSEDARQSCVPISGWRPVTAQDRAGEEHGKAGQGKRSAQSDATTGDARLGESVSFACF